MRASLKRLLDKAIDYAGLFPPAKLGMEEAVPNMHRYASGEAAWIVDRFVCPASGLDELTRVLRASGNAAPLPVSVVGRPANDRKAWDAAREADATDMTEFEERAGEMAEIVGYELSIPSLVDAGPCFRDLRGFDSIEVFVELPWSAGQLDALGALADTEWLQAKARTGGVTPEAFPSASDLAAFVHECVSLDVPFKLTAGLHHPFPARDPASGAQAHGFVSVLGATALAYAQDLSRKEIQAVLEDPSPEAWRFEADRLEWRGFAADLAGIDESRNLLLSFGSCSVEEPLHDLKSLGLAGRQRP